MADHAFDRAERELSSDCMTVAVALKLRLQISLKCFVVKAERSLSRNLSSA